MVFLYSFIIPHKNNPELLQRCVDSIPNREDIQIIVVDDNSDDEKKPNLTRENLEIIFLDKTCSRGAGHARNVGLTKAIGKWILFADADDYYEARFIEILDSYQDDDSEVVFFNAKSVDSETLLPAGRTNIMQKFFDDCDENIRSVDKVKFGTHFPWNKMVKRTFLKKYNIWFEEIPKGNDTLFSYCVGFLASQVKIDKRIVYVYTWTKNSLTTKKIGYNLWLTVWENYFKQQNFLKFVGCDDLRISLPRFFSRLVKQQGFSNAIVALWVLCIGFVPVKRQSTKYVDIVKQLALCKE